MPRLPLGTAYASSSRIAGAQRSVNLYAEVNQDFAPSKRTLYPRPGLTPCGAGPPTAGFARTLYTSSTGDLYAVVNQTLYYIDPDYVWHPLRNLVTVGTTPVYIADNGQNAILVDGTTNGISINLATRTATAINDVNFLGGSRIAFLNFFLLINELNSPNFYSTQATSIIFNALFFGSMTQSPGNCLALISSEAALWLFNSYKGEVWSDAGTSPFAFQPLPGVIIEHGIVNSFALARGNVNVYWFSQSTEGGCMAQRGANLTATRISTHAIEREWRTYPRVDDCIVQTYQIRGHLFVLFHFITADRTWVFDEAIQEWHEEAYYDYNGVQHRTRDTFMAYAYGKNLSLDWLTGQLYQRDESNFTDNGVPQLYIRDISHIVDEEDDRVTVWRVIADVECGNGTGTSVPIGGSPWSMGFSPGFGPQTLTEPPAMTLYISHDRGYSYFAHSDQLMAGPYGFNTKPTFYRCGVAYDTVLRFQWSGPFRTALNDPFVTFEKHDADA